MMDERRRYNLSRRRSRSGAAGRTRTSAGYLLTFLTHQPMRCAQCRGTIAADERFALAWRSSVRKRAVVCQRCLELIEFVGPDAALNNPRSTGGPAMSHTVAFSDAQWTAIEPMVPVTVTKQGAMSDQAVFVAVLYRFRNQCTWTEVPERYGRWQACRWRYQRWITVHALAGMPDAFLATLPAHQRRLWAPLLKREEEQPT